MSFLSGAYGFTVAHWQLLLFGTVVVASVLNRFLYGHPVFSGRLRQFIAMVAAVPMPGARSAVFAYVASKLGDGAAAALFDWLSKWLDLPLLSKSVSPPGSVGEINPPRGVAPLPVLLAIAIGALVAMAGVAHAADVAPVSLPGVVVFSGTSPAAPGTSPQAQLALPLDRMSYCDLTARLVGATGGVLDVFIQSSSNNGAAGSWKDVVHFPQLANGAAAIGYSVTLLHGTSTSPPVVVNAVDGTPVLAANTVLPGSLGNNLRVVFVAGAGTSAGGAETITAYCSSL